MVALNASIVILGLLRIQIVPIIKSSLCVLIFQRLKSDGIFVFIEEVLNVRQFVNGER